MPGGGVEEGENQGAPGVRGCGQVALVWPAPVRMTATVYTVIAPKRSNESNFEPAGRRFNSCRAHQRNRGLMPLLVQHYFRP